MEERPFHPLDYVSVVRRRKWWLIVPLVASIVVGALLATFLPKEYYTEAEIGVAAPTLSPEILKGVSSLDAAERERAVSQHLLSRTVLERVVREEKIEPNKPVEEVVGWLRNHVVINVSKPIGRADNRNGLDSFRLGYADSTADATQRITNRLAYVFVEENSRTATERAENTSEILAQQLRDSQEKLTNIEAQLSVKKQAHMGRLPDQINTNVQMVNGLRQQLESISMGLRGEQDRLSMIEAQIEEMRRGGAGAGAVTSTDASNIQSVQARITQLQQQLTQARAMGYTDKHPEITWLQQEIAQARAEMKTSRPESAGGRDELLGVDPMYRQRLLDRDTARLRIRQLRAAESQARGQIGLYQSRVESAPMVEQELQGVTREYELEKGRYADLKNRHEAALLEEDITRKQGGERFSVLYPAGLPTRPQKPDQLRLMLIATALGLALGVGMAVGREFMDRSVHDIRALQNEFAVPVLGEIPRIHGAA
jgi:polysaccharide chain length determinant protein (PEP-CTERM system associated)